MSGQLWLEEPCEHGFVDPHGEAVTSPPLTASNQSEVIAHIAPVFPDLCPGGSRRRVTVDWEAGLQTMHRLIHANMEGADWSSEEQVLHIIGDALGVEWEELLSIVDAALEVDQ